MKRVANREPESTSEIALDTLRWPLLVFRYPTAPTVPSVLAMYADWERLFERGPHAALTDLRAFNPIFASPTIRKLMASEVEKRRSAFERLLVAEARVVGDRLTHGMVTAFDWIVGSTFARPMKNTTSITEAETFLLEELRKRDLR